MAVPLLPRPAGTRARQEPWLLPGADVIREKTAINEEQDLANTQQRIKDKIRVSFCKDLKHFQNQFEIEFEDCTLFSRGSAVVVRRRGASGPLIVHSWSCSWKLVYKRGCFLPVLITGYLMLGFSTHVHKILRTTTAHVTRQYGSPAHAIDACPPGSPLLYLPQEHEHDA